MSWASQDCVPANLGLTGYGDSSSQNVNQLNFKAVPRTSTNAVFDCTAATGVTFHAYPIGSNPDFCNTTITASITAADATGITVQLTAANLKTFLLKGGSSAYNVSLEATDGVTTLILGQGVMNLKYGA